jgi:cytochrome c2
MNRSLSKRVTLMGVAALFTAVSGLATAEGEKPDATNRPSSASVAAGRQVYERHCRTCHGGTAAADSPIGPSLVGIIGKKAGTQPSGVHSLASIDSGIVWDRASLRRFLSAPSREIPGTSMPVSVTDPAELESLLDYLESLSKGTESRPSSDRSVTTRQVAGR